MSIFMGAFADMKEDFLHFIWQNQYLQTDLKTVDGLSVVVKNKGTLNTL